MSASTTLLVALLCSAFVISNSAVRGDEPAFIPAPAKEFFPQPTEREARLDAALDQHLSIAFEETPLAGVAAWFASKLEAPVILDHRSLADAGIGSETPVTRKVEGISARAALKLVLDDMDLASVQKDGVLIVMSQDSAEAELVTRVYPVGDLTPQVARQPSAAHGVVGPHGGIGAASAGGGTGQFSVADEPVSTQQLSGSNATVEANPKAPPAQMVPDFDSLIEVVTSTVKPQTWDKVGGPGSISEMVGREEYRRFADARSARRDSGISAIAAGRKASQRSIRWQIDGRLRLAIPRRVDPPIAFFAERG